MKNKDSIVDKKLKVLFVSSGNLKNFDVAPFIKVQGDSLNNENVEVGKGIERLYFKYWPIKETIEGL